MTSHFRRLHGSAAGEEQRDQYITELANAQSQEMIRQGPSACRNMAPLFQRALALRNAGEIALLSAANDVTAIDYPIAACGPAGAPTTTAAAAAPTAPAAAPPAAKRWTEPVEQEGNPRDEEILRLQNRLEQLERLLDRQQDPVLRRVGPSRQVAKKDR